jgi:fermentation-respiration switch protein FrsA (DUF1100 family)
MRSRDPPLLIVHGTVDTVVPFRFAESLARRAKEIGVPCEFHRWKARLMPPSRS